MTQVYYITDMVISLLIPFICISICYVRICNKIFTLKKIRTISRHFSKKDLFKRTKSAQQLEEKKLKLARKNKESGEPKKDNGVNVTYVSDVTNSDFALFQRNDKQSGKKKDNKLVHHELSTDAQYSTEIMRESSLCSGIECESSFNAPDLSSFNAPDLEVCQESCLENVPSTSKFSAFKIDCSDEKFDICPVESPNPQKISSFNKMENHYNAIAAAKDELAKKMRVYKYQLRVARTAVVICTLFIICYVPYAITVALMVIDPAASDSECESHRNSESGATQSGPRKLDFKGWAHFFLFLNSACNVIIYGLMHRTVRKQLSKIMLVCCSKPPQPADLSRHS